MLLNDNSLFHERMKKAFLACAFCFAISDHVMQM